MATQRDATAVMPSTVSVEPQGPLNDPQESWDHTTESALMTDDRTRHFIEATGDDQKPHLNDNAARALPFNFKSRIMHGTLVRDVAVNYLVQRDLARRLGVEKTHAAMDKGGTYTPLDAVYPGEKIHVRYNYRGRVRPRGTFPIGIEYAVFVLRDGQETKVMIGIQNALLVFYRKT